MVVVAVVSQEADVGVGVGIVEQVAVVGSLNHVEQ